MKYSLMELRPPVCSFVSLENHAKPPWRFTECTFLAGRPGTFPIFHTLKAGLLHFDPEWGMLYISESFCTKYCDTKCNMIGHVPEFLHDLKNFHDPRGVGLLNLAVDRLHVLSDIGWESKQADVIMSTPFKESFFETMAQLRQVFLISMQRSGRHVLGFEHEDPIAEDQENLSFPVANEAPRFIRLGPDPGLIDQDLFKVFIQRHPNEMIDDWRQFW